MNLKIFTLCFDKMNTTSPKSSLAKLGILSYYNKQKTLKVMVVGQCGVGKTALVVRFITRRFIGEYDPNLEKIYTFNTIMDNEQIQFDILDAMGPSDENSCFNLESGIRWADVFIIMYSVTDKCSFDECNRLRFLINYNKRRRKLVTNNKDYMADVPIILVGNKIDQYDDRMVYLEDGQRRFKELSCSAFHEISVRESVDQVQSVFRDVFHFWRIFNKFSKLKPSTSDVQTIDNAIILSPDCSSSVPGFSCYHNLNSLMHDNRKSILIISNTYLEESTDHMDSTKNLSSNSLNNCSGIGFELQRPFRSRASTEGTLLNRPHRWLYPPPGCLMPFTNCADRRMSISARGNNVSY